MENQNDISLTNEFAVGTTVFGKYEILNFVASGGSGRVYKAQDTLRKVDVALKVLLLESFDDKQLMRFQSEAQTASKLSHSNISTVYDFGLSDGMPYLVMEFVDGLTLEQMLEGEQRLELPDFLDFFIQIAEAVNHAHNNGVIHRDIKPGNVIVKEQPDGTMVAKILDFGVAKIIDNNGERSGKQTPTGNIVGSPLYMSPEQARGLQVTPQSDCYSIGSLMFRCLTGRPPIQAETSIETIMRVANEPAPLLAEEPDIEIPVELCDLVDALLSKNPSLRPSLQEVVLPTLRKLRNPEEFNEAEENDDSTAGNTTPLLAKVQHFPFASKAAILALILLSGCLSAYTIWSRLSDNSRTEAVSLDLKGTDFSHVVKTPKITEASTTTTPEAAETKKSTSLKGPDVKANYNNIYDDELGLIENPEGVKFIRAKGNHLSTLATIGRFKNLEELEIGTTEVNDRALEQLIQLKKLYRLDLQNNDDITDVGMLSLSKIGSLAILNLSQTPNVTSLGLRKLSTLFQLRMLILRDSLFTRADVEKFAPAVNPECHIDLSNSPKLSRNDLEQLSAKFPDLEFIYGRKTVTKGMTEPYTPMLLHPIRTAADNQILRKNWLKAVAKVEQAYGKDTVRSRYYYIYIPNLDGGSHDQKIIARRVTEYKKAAKLAHQAGDQKCELEALDLLTGCLIDSKGFTGAKAVGLQAIALAGSIEGPEPNPKQTHRYSGLALAAVHEQHYAEAEGYYKKAIAILQDLDKDSRSVGVLFGSLGDCLIGEKKYSEAAESFKKANQIFKEKEPTTEGERNANLMAFGHRAWLFSIQNNLDEAMKIHRIFYPLAMKPGTPILYTQSAVDQRIDLFTKMKHPQSEIDALHAQRAKLDERIRRGEIRI